MTLRLDLTEDLFHLARFHRPNVPVRDRAFPPTLPPHVPLTLVAGTTASGQKFWQVVGPEDEVRTLLQRIT